MPPDYWRPDYERLGPDGPEGGPAEGSPEQAPVDERTALAQRLMEDVVASTGLEGAARPRRYLWTDAFAVFNLLALYGRTDEERYLSLAQALVSQVHAVLGRHRADDERRGWISGLGEREGARRPTAGGLRIGKPGTERPASEPYDPRSEWDRDGQYFHYLTKWMWALHQTAQVTGLERYHRWAVELARTAFHHFAIPTEGGGHQIVWKKSVDLSRAQVPSAGQHDALDGYVTFLALEASTRELDRSEIPSLQGELDDLAGMLEQTPLVTQDPLGIGGLLVSTHRLACLRQHGDLLHLELLEALVESSAQSLEEHNLSTYRRPPDVRLAFRELGLAIGLHAADRMVSLGLLGRGLPFGVRSRASWMRALGRHVHTADKIEAFWRDPHHRRVVSWRRHQDINTVMLATSLVPEGYLA